MSMTWEWPYDPYQKVRECKHVDTDITTGRFKVGDRVMRDIRFNKGMADDDPWGDDLQMTGTVIRAYSQEGCLHGPYDELYDVKWDDAFATYWPADGRPRQSVGFLPHGLEPENVFKSRAWLLHPELLSRGRKLQVHDRVRITRKFKNGTTQVFEAKVTWMEEREGFDYFGYIPLLPGKDQWNYNHCKWGCARDYHRFYNRKNEWDPIVEVIGKCTRIFPL